NFKKKKKVYISIFLFGLFASFGPSQKQTPPPPPLKIVLISAQFFHVLFVAFYVFFSIVIYARLEF
uniref:hypothetical protein n=1 Tax=Peptoniphilus grossensis TaxID=1465756 RepID=UPI0028896713